jgi:hypothetical protein
MRGGRRGGGKNEENKKEFGKPRGEREKGGGGSWAQASLTHFHQPPSYHHALPFLSFFTIQIRHVIILTHMAPLKEAIIVDMPLALRLGM